MVRIIFEPMHKEVLCESGTTILEAQHMAGIIQDAPCGGHGKCGKCRVEIDGREVLACQTHAEQDMTVKVKEFEDHVQIMTAGLEEQVDENPVNPGKYQAAVDIGTTTMVCYLLDGETGEKLAQSSMLNPQFPYGMDVISRIQAAIKGDMEHLVQLVRDGLSKLLMENLEKLSAKAEEIGTICIVGNPTMQQLFLGISPENLAAVPFAPVLTKAEVKEASDYLPMLTNAKLLVVPDIAGYVGADTMGCVLSTKMYEKDTVTLMIDIGTNGEMVLGNKEKMMSCSTAAGPALEGARISCGMRGATGAIDHVKLVDGQREYSVIGGRKIEEASGHGAGEIDEQNAETSEQKAEEICKAEGICGSGLIDLIAVLLDQGILNKRGRMNKDYEEDEKGQRFVNLIDGLTLTQDDVREVQMAKGAIRAGIMLMTQEMGLEISQIDEVVLAGAFGSFINPKSACRIGLIPEELLPKIHAVGNAAGMGSRMMALNKDEFEKTQKLIAEITPLELAALPGFQKAFAKGMGF